MWGFSEVSQTSKIKGEKCGCVGVAPHVRTLARLKAIQVSEMSNGKPRETVVAVQNVAVQETHGDRLVSVRFCLGTGTFKGFASTYSSATSPTDSYFNYIYGTVQSFTSFKFSEIPT